MNASQFAAASLLGTPGPVGNANGGTDTNCYLSEIRLMAGASVPLNWVIAHGQLLPIAGNQALFSLLGTTYGGDGKTNFALPNLSGAEARGAGPAGVNYYICASGIFP